MTVAEDNAPEVTVPPSGTSGSGDDSTSGAEPQQRESLFDAVADLLQMSVDWIRAEASDLVRDKFVMPVQRLGLTLASATAAGCLVVVGLNFVFAAVLMFMAQLLGWPGALLLLGGVILVGAAVFTVIKMRSIQK